MSHKSPFEPQSRGKMPENWPFALRHEHNLCKKKSRMEKCLPRLQRCHGSLKGAVSPIQAADTASRFGQSRGLILKTRDSFRVRVCVVKRLKLYGTMPMI